MHTAMAWLNQHQAAVIALATVVTAVTSVVLAVTTIVYAWHTRNLANENTRLRKAETDPQVVAYASIDPLVFGAMNFVIANVGRGPARNVRFDVVTGGDDFGTKEVRLPHAAVTFNFLPQDEKISQFMNMGWTLLAPPALAPFKVDVAYESMDGEKYKSRFIIDISPFTGLVRLGEPPEEQIAKAVKEIADEVKRWTRGRLPAEVITSRERQQNDAKARRQFEERIGRAATPSDAT
jgi:hypothetical protein